MILLVLTNPSTAYAEAVSEKLWSLGRPESTRDENYVTKYYCGWVQHPETGQVALEMPTETAYIHPDSDPVDVAKDMPITSSEKAQFASSVNNSKGKKTQTSGLVPESLIENILTVDEAVLEGWYPSRID